MQPPRARAAGAGYADDVIVVLTDGSNNRGVDPQTAARQAAQRSVRVYTIGFGTDNPAPLACGSGQFGAFRGIFAAGGSVSSLRDRYGALVRISRPPAARSTARRTPVS